MKSENFQQNPEGIKILQYRFKKYYQNSCKRKYNTKANSIQRLITFFKELFVHNNAM